MKQQHETPGLVTRVGKLPLLGLLALGALAPVGACSSDPLGDHGESVGTIGVNLEAAPGVTLDTVTYTITGNGFSKTGSIDTSGAPVISGTIGGIPAGKNYTLTLNASSVESGSSVSGSAKFDVTAAKTTAVTIHLKGAGTRGNGNVAVTGTLNIGPVIDEFTVTPLTAYVGESVALKGVGSDADDGPSPLSYYWSATGGAIDDPIEPNATLTSATPGTFTVKLTVSDGDSTDTITSTVTFVEHEAEGGGGGGGLAKRPNILLIIAADPLETTNLYSSAPHAAAFASREAELATLEADAAPGYFE